MSEIKDQESKVQSPKSNVEEVTPNELAVIDAEVIEDSVDEAQNSKFENQSSKIKVQRSKPELTKDKEQRTKDKRPVPQSAVRNYLLLPIIFLTVTLLGGLRLGAETNAFIFLKPALVCLIFATVLLVLFFRTGLLRLEGWFSDNFTTLKNVANAFVLFTLFTASVQLFNSLLPEQGLPFWTVALLFFWTLWNNLFSVFTAERLLKSLGSLFGLAFVLKYLILASLTAPANESWLRAMIENPTKEVFTYLLDLPRFSAGTGYIQFFTVIFYLLGLFLLPPTSEIKE